MEAREGALGDEDCVSSTVYEVEMVELGFLRTCSYERRLPILANVQIVI
jgi:hypothetical protein